MAYLEEYTPHNPTDEYDEVAASDGRGIYAVCDSSDGFVHSFDVDLDWFVRSPLWVGIADNPADALDRFAVGEGFARYADSDMRREVAGWSWDDMGSDPAGAVAPFTNHEVYSAKVADIADTRRATKGGGDGAV